MTSTKTVLLKGELHSSDADFREEKALLTDDVDVLVLEGSEPRSGRRLLSGWFSVSVALLAWILESLYHPMEPLVDLASARDVDVVYTRPDDVAPFENAPTTMRAVSAGLFYTLVPGSLWIGFVTQEDLAGSLLLFLGLVLPVLVVRVYNANRPSSPGYRDRRIAETIAGAGGPGEHVVAIVGVGHLHAVRRELPASIDVTVREPAYDVWSLRHLADVGLPAVKAGFVLFSLYVVCVWIMVQVVTYVTPIVASAFS